MTAAVKPFRFRKRKTVPGIAREILRCFEDKRRWTTDAFARTATGNPIGSACPGAVCWCLVGALSQVSDSDRARERFYVVGSLTHLNDHDGLPAVRRVLRKLAKGKVHR